MAGQGFVGIGLKIDYEKSLQQMTNDFNKALTQISNEAKKTNYTANVEKQIGALKGEIKGFSDEFRQEFERINNQKIDSSNFEAFQTKVTQEFEKIEGKFASINTKIHGLREQLKLLDGSDFATGMKKQFEDVRRNVMNTYNGLKQILELNKNQPKVGVDAGIADSSERYLKTLDFIKKIKAEIASISGNKMDANFDFMGDYLDKSELLERQVEAYKRLSQEMKNIPRSSPEYEVKENALIRIQAAAEKTRNALLAVDDAYGKYNGDATMFDARDEALLKSTKGFETNIDSFVAKVEKINQSAIGAKQSVEQIQGTFKTFQLKDGAIHIPIDIATKSSALKDRLQGIIQELRTYANSTPIIAPVKLTLDKSSSKGYEKNSEIDKQQVEGQKEQALDITKTIQNTYRQAAREAKQIVKTEMATIQKEFESVPVKIKPDTEAFKGDLQTMINDSFKAIAEGTTGLSINSELEKLVVNLEKVSASLSNNGNFKFGLDEAAIERITAAISNMANMIQRAFGVASDSDIATQWGAIESKFKAVAGEEGRLLKGNKDHKVAIQELAVEYKKYLDMGGKNDLSALTSHKQTIKNITAEYENLGKAAQEAAQKQDQQANQNPVSTKMITSEATEAAANANLDLGIAAEMTTRALTEEGEVAQSVAGRFSELEKEKKAAADANLDLGAAAELTTEALKKEADAQKAVNTKVITNKKAVDESVYMANASAWQNDIKRSLLDSGEYSEIYESNIAQAANGTVKFTATLKTMGDELNGVEGEWKKFSATVDSSGNLHSVKMKDVVANEVAKIERTKELLSQLLASAGGKEKAFLNRDALESNVSKIIEATQALETFNTKYRVFLNETGKLSIVQQITGDDGKIKEFTANFSDVESVIAAITDKTRNFKQVLAESFDSGSFVMSTKNFVSQAQSAFDTFKLKYRKDSNWGLVADDIERLKQSIAGINSESGLKRFKQDLSDVALKLKNISKDNKLGRLFNGNTQTFKDISEVRANIDSLFASIGKVNAKSIRISGTDKLTANVKAANGEIHKMTVRLDSNNFARFVDNGIIQFGRLREAVGGIFKGIAGYLRYYLSPYMLVSYTRQVLEQVKEIDTAMTELRKVSDAPAGDITAYFGDAVSSAKELGATVKDMISATADWSRLGYNLPDSRELGEVAVLYKNVGDGIDIDAANESLVSTIQGFQLQASDAMSVIDSFNEVSNNYAISSAGIGEALKRSAAAFNAANTDLNQSIALITAGNEIVQSPEKVGKEMPTCTVMYRK